MDRPSPSVTGTRVRERRIALGRRQADLARAVGISPSYLNLIEHNRRRIGGKLVHQIARELGVEAGQLTDGAEAGLLEGLRAAAAGHAAAGDPQLEDFAARHPTWAALVVDTARRAQAMERAVEVLSDRMTHDPFLSASVHEVLSTVTAIRSTAAILAETPDIDTEWRHRFHRNLEEDAARLAGSAEDLVRFLDAAGDTEPGGSTPMEEFDLWLAGHDYLLPGLERALPPSPEAFVAGAEGLESAAARDLALRHVRRYCRDAAAMPLRSFRQTVQRLGCDPLALAAEFGADLAAVFRRLAVLPPDVLGARMGLVCCDGSGTPTFRKPLPDFDLPRHSAACPLWPLYEALAQPMRPLRRLIRTGGHAGARFVAFAQCQPLAPPGFDMPPVLEATMLIVPADLVHTAPRPAEAGIAGPADPAPVRAGLGAALRIGTTCRVCARAACPARREPAIVAPEPETGPETGPETDPQPDPGTASRRVADRP